MDKRYCDTKSMADLMAEQIRLINENIEKARLAKVKKLESEHKKMVQEMIKAGYSPQSVNLCENGNK